MTGWIDNLYELAGIAMRVGLGIIRTMHLNGKLVGDMFPCGMVS